MVRLCPKKINGKVYLYVYEGRKYIQSLGREDQYTPEKINYILKNMRVKKLEEDKRNKSR
jgi:hypothetical protein